MNASALAKPATNAPWIDTCILIGSGLFVFALGVAAAFVPNLRVLHVLQALVYVAVVILTRRQSAWGFGVGVAAAAFWNAVGFFATPPLLLNGVQELWAATRTGQVQHPDLMLMLLAGAGHVLIIIACLVGFFRTRPGARQWAEFLAGGVLVTGYVAAIVFAVGPPQSVALFRRILGL